MLAGHFFFLLPNHSAAGKDVYLQQIFKCHHKAMHELVWMLLVIQSQIQIFSAVLYCTGEQFSQLLWVKVLNTASKFCQRKCHPSHLHSSSQDKEGHCTPTSPSSSNCRVETWRPHKIFYCFSPACPYFDGL